MGDDKQIFNYKWSYGYIKFNDDQNSFMINYSIKFIIVSKRFGKSLF